MLTQMKKDMRYHIDKSWLVSTEKQFTYLYIAMFQIYAIIYAFISSINISLYASRCVLSKFFCNLSTNSSSPHAISLSRSCDQKAWVACRYLGSILLWFYYSFVVVAEWCTSVRCHNHRQMHTTEQYEIAWVVYDITAFLFLLDTILSQRWCRDRLMYPEIARKRYLQLGYFYVVIVLIDQILEVRESVYPWYCWEIKTTVEW